MKTILVLCGAVLMAQTQRLPLKTTPLLTNVRSYDWSPAQETTLSSLSPGQGLVNSYGVCVIRVTANGFGHDYVGPSPMNGAKNWIMTLTPAGGRRISWIGARTVTSQTPGTSCSAPVSTPIAIPGIPTGVGNNTFQWHPGNTGNALDDYKLLTTSLEGSHQIKLWMLSCDVTNAANKCNPADATEAASTNWQWTLVKDFDGSDGEGPYIDWTNAAFCTSGCGGGSPTYMDTSGIKLWLVAWDGTTAVMSIRGSSKYEYGTAFYNINTGVLNVQYLDATGELASATPTPATCTKGNGAITWKNFSVYTAYQMNGDPSYGACPGTSSAKFYRSPIATSRVGTFTSAQSITGTRFVAHSAIWNNGIVTPSVAASGPPNWGTYPGNPGEYNWIGALRKYDATGSQNPADDYHMPWNTVFHWQDYDMQGGLHLSTPTRTDKDKWVAATFYNQDNKAARSQRTIAEEIILVDYSSSSSLPGVPTYPDPLTYGTFRRLLQHNTCVVCTGGGYDTQGHGAFNLDGSLLFFKSTQNRTDGSGGYAVYMAVIPPDITW